MGIEVLAVSWIALQGQLLVQEFGYPGDETVRFQVRTPIEKSQVPKVSPKHHWIFEYSTGCYARSEVDPETLALKFRIFGQSLKDEGDPAPLVGRMLTRLWDYNFRQLRIDHNIQYNSGIVDLYLCFGGEPGGEQLFDEEFENKVAKRVNTIYIYQIGTFTNPVEMAREIAHEYGHAVLPPVGGFKSPEDWANGYLGEKLYMRYLANNLIAGHLKPGDAMGASVAGLKAYVAKEVDPLWTKVASVGPQPSLLGATGPAAMNAYLGLALYGDLILPKPVFARSLKIIGSVRATDYPDAIVNAVAERERVELRVPISFAGRPFWIPMPLSSKLEGAKLVSRRSGWAVVTPTSKSITIVMPQS